MAYTRKKVSSSRRKSGASRSRSGYGRRSGSKRSTRNRSRASVNTIRLVVEQVGPQTGLSGPMQTESAKRKKAIF